MLYKVGVHIKGHMQHADREVCTFQAPQPRGKGTRRCGRGNRHKKEAASSNTWTDPTGNAPWPLPLARNKVTFPGLLRLLWRHKPLATGTFPHTPGDGAATSVLPTAAGTSQRCSGTGSCRGSSGKEPAGSRSRSALTPGRTRRRHGTTNPPQPPAAPSARSQPRAPPAPSAAPTCAGAASELRRRLTGLRPPPPLPGPHRRSANGASAAPRPPCRRLRARAAPRADQSARQNHD